MEDGAASSSAAPPTAPAAAPAAPSPPAAAPDDDDDVQTIEEIASSVAPNHVAVSTLLAHIQPDNAANLTSLLDTPSINPAFWAVSRTFEYSDSCIKGKPAVKKECTVWLRQARPCDGVARKVMWEFSDSPGDYFPPLEEAGYVELSARKNGRLYRLYVGENGHSFCATKISTNRIVKNTVPEKGKATSPPLCFICFILCKADASKRAESSLFGVKKMICNTCAGFVGVEKHKPHPCHGILADGVACTKEAKYNKLVDGDGEKYFFCYGCFKRTHGVAPEPQKFATCECDLKRQFNNCTDCCIAANRPLSKRTCCVFEDGNYCNTRMDPQQSLLSLSHFPDKHPLCPRHLAAALGEKPKREKRENLWRAATEELVRAERPAYRLFEEVTFGGAAKDAACLASAAGMDEKKWRRVDFGLFLLHAAFVLELDQRAHSEKSYSCDHNSRFSQHVFDCLRQLRGEQGGRYDVYVLRVNPDGKGADGNRISAAQDEGVELCARVTKRALFALVDHAVERQARRDAGQDVAGKCFLVHLFYAPDSLQLANEAALCARMPETFELLQV